MADDNSDIGSSDAGGGLLASVPQIFKLIAGINQTAKANAINPVRPTYSVPKGVDEAVNTAKAQYYNPRLPQEDYISGRIGSSAATSIRAATQSGRTPAEILAAAAGAEDNQNEAFTNLVLEGERQKNANASMLEGQLDNQGVWQYKASDYNERQPYQEEVNAKSALTQAGNENIYGGLKGVASAIIGGGASKSNPQGGSNPFLNIIPKLGTGSGSIIDSLPAAGGSSLEMLAPLLLG